MRARAVGRARRKIRLAHHVRSSDVQEERREAGREKVRERVLSVSLTLSTGSPGFNVPLENSPCQFFFFFSLDSSPEEQHNRSGSAAPSHERRRREGSERGRACGLVIKPLRPDVHLNQKLFPVVGVFLSYCHVCLPPWSQSTQRGEGFSESWNKQMSKKTHQISP